MSFPPNSHHFIEEPTLIKGGATSAGSVLRRKVDFYPGRTYAPAQKPAAKPRPSYTAANYLGFPLLEKRNQRMKRAFDVIISAAILLVALPLVFLPVAILIKLTSPGSVFFMQERTGFRNRTFKIFKFRTMRANNDNVECQQNDLRVTRIGRILRSTSIDELPQFINVLRGEMSIVGPRPHMLVHTDLYAGLLDNYLDRHLVLPGITGLAQVNGFRGPTEQDHRKMEDRVNCDITYINNWSFRLDVHCFLSTLKVFSGKDVNAF